MSSLPHHPTLNLHELHQKLTELQQNQEKRENDTLTSTDAPTHENARKRKRVLQERQKGAVVGGKKPMQNTAPGKPQQNAPNATNSTASSLQKKLAKQQIRQKEALMMQIAKLQSMMHGAKEDGTAEENAEESQDTAQQHSDLLRQLEESSENRSVLLNELQQWVVEKLTQTHDEQEGLHGGIQRGDDDEVQVTQPPRQQHQTRPRHPHQAAYLEEESTTFSSIYRDDSIEDFDEMDEYEEVTQPQDDSSDEEHSGDDTTESDEEDRYYRPAASESSFTSSTGIMPSPVHHIQNAPNQSHSNTATHANNFPPTNERRWPSTFKHTIDTDSVSLSSMRDYSPLSNTSIVGASNSSSHTVPTDAHHHNLIHQEVPSQLTTNTPLQPSPRQKPTSDELRLERHVQMLKKENLSLGQNYMKALEQNEELLQDVDILTEKYRHCNERMVILEKIIEQKQQEMEKKEKSFEKRMRYMSGQLNVKEAEKDGLHKELTTEIEHLNLQLSDRDKQLMEQDQQLEEAEKAAKEYERRISALKEEKRSHLERIQNLERRRDAHEIENRMIAQQKAALEQENQKLLTEITSLTNDKEQLEEKVTTQEREITQLNDKIPKEPYHFLAPKSDACVQTMSVDASVVDRKISLQEQLLRETSDYVDFSRRCCIRVRQSHDEFVAKMLHAVKHEISDTAVQFVNKFGATHNVDTLAIDEWIGRFRDTYAKHIESVQAMCEAQYQTYKAAFNQDMMNASRDNLLRLTQIVLYDGGESGSGTPANKSQNQSKAQDGKVSPVPPSSLPLVLTPDEQTTITAKMYHELRMELDDAKKKLLDVQEDNTMLQTQLKVMEATQGKLSNVAEVERQLRRAQIRTQTLEEECQEYHERCDALEAQLYELQLSLKKSGLVSLDDDPPFEDGDLSEDELPQLSNDGRITEFQVYEDGKRITLSNSMTGARRPSETFQDKVLMETKIFSSCAGASRYPSFEYDPTTHDMHIKLERAMVEAKTQKQYAKFSRLIRQLKSQINEIHQSMRVLLNKLDAHEVKKLQEKSDENAPEWLQSLLQERSTDLMRASERLITRYAKAVESTDRKIQEFVREPITLFNSVEDKITEDDLYKFKDNYELQFLKLAEHALQQKLDAMMTEACQKYPLRAVDEESVSADVATFLSRQLPVVSEVLIVVLNKMLTLHRSSMDYIDRLLAEKREASYMGQQHYMSGMDSWSNDSFVGTASMVGTPATGSRSTNVLKYIYPTPSREPPVELNRFQAQRKEVYSRQRSELHSATTDESQQDSGLPPRGPRTRNSFSLFGNGEATELPPPAQHALHILEHEKHLRSQRVQTRWAYWICRKILLKLEAEIYAVMARTTESENGILLQNLKAMREYQLGRCERMRKRLEKYNSQQKRNTSAALHALTEFIQLSSRQDKSFDYFKHNETIATSESDGTKTASSVGLDSSLQSKVSSSMKVAASRLKLQSREPLEREKLIHLQPAGVSAGSARRHSSNASLIEQRGDEFSIFRTKRSAQEEQGKKLSSTLPSMNEGSNAAQTKHSLVGLRPPKKLRLASAPSTQQGAGIPDSHSRARKPQGAPLTTAGRFPRVNHSSGTS